MPWCIERLNARKSQPNRNIVFIKPLPGPSEQAAQSFLERIAAQCWPIMRKHHLHVMSLEEFEPNREFVGRNFNAGEVIQLVLKSASTGRWLPLEYVQMVMMHELAHCKQMNHSRTFWAVRNGYAAEMHQLWKEGYSGEGIWGRGAKLGTGEWERQIVGADDALPDHTCGGMFRTRVTKRKKKTALTHQERQARRIRKRFGESGTALGADDAKKTRLERGKTIKAMPRVANSERGRKLRAAAALARFGQAEQQTGGVDDEEGNGDATESSTDDDEDAEAASGGDVNDAIDVNGRPLLDSKGRSMIRVCEDGDANDTNAEDELAELRQVLGQGPIKRESAEAGVASVPKENEGAARQTRTQIVPTNTVEGAPRRRRATRTTGERDARPFSASLLSGKTTPAPAPAPANRPAGLADEGNRGEMRPKACSACSLINLGPAATCAACANVLEPAMTSGTWRCRGEQCASTSYANSGDCGVCGLCGRRRDMLGI